MRKKEERKINIQNILFNLLVSLSIVVFSVQIVLVQGDTNIGSSSEQPFSITLIEPGAEPLILLPDQYTKVITFRFSLDSENDLTNCGLYVDDISRATLTADINKNGENSFELELGGPESYEWKVVCVDSVGVSVTSETRTLVIETEGTTSIEPPPSTSTPPTSETPQQPTEFTVTLLAPTDDYITTNTVLPFVARFDLDEASFNSGKRLEKSTLSIWKVNRGKEIIQNAKSALEQEIEEEGVVSGSFTSLIEQELEEEEQHTSVYRVKDTGISWMRDYSVLFEELQTNEIYLWNFEACTNDGVCKSADNNFTLIITEGGATTEPAPQCDVTEGFLDQIPEPVKIIGGIIIGFILFSIISRFLPGMKLFG